MSMSDPIADMLTRIRNAQMVSKKTVTMSASILKMAIANVLLEQGYIQAMDKIEGTKAEMILTLKYHNNEGVIESIKRISRPGLRNYVSVDDIPDIMGGLGIVIMSTSKGVITGKTAKELNLGGELLCSVF